MPIPTLLVIDALPVAIILPFTVNFSVKFVIVPIPTLPALGYVSEGIAFYAPTAIPNAAPANIDTEIAARPYGSGTSKDGVSYEGPALASYIPGLISPFFFSYFTRASSRALSTTSFIRVLSQ